MAKLDNAIGWFEIYVEDIERATAFYEAVFQLSLSRQKMGDKGPEMALFPHKHGTRGAAARWYRCRRCAAPPQMVRWSIFLR